MNEKPKNADIRVSSPLLVKLENFWYHYKWHTLIALFLVMVAAVCIAQVAKKQSYDVYILYAGDHDIPRTSQAGGVTEYGNLLTGFKKIAHDRDGNGEKTVSLQALFMMTNEQIQAFNKENPDYEVNVGLVKDNESILTSNLLYSDYYICLLSPEIYEAYGKTGDGMSLFTPIAPYVGDASVEYADDYAVRLSSTPFGALPGFADLPDDTLICLRILSSIADTKNNRKIYASAEETLRAIFAYR